MMLTFDFQEDYKLPYFRVMRSILYFAHKQIVSVFGICNESLNE